MCLLPTIARVSFFSFALSLAVAAVAETPIFLQPKPAVELSWSMEEETAAIEISSDGETWEAISPTRTDGNLAYWITTVEKAPVLARKTLGNSGAERGGHLVVDLDEGVRQVKIEVFDDKTQLWKPRVLANLEGKAGTLPFSLNGDFNLSNIRVSISEQAIFDFTFTSIAHEFGSQVVSKNRLQTPGFGAFDFAGERDSSDQTVEESDIWRIHGDRLFFFNHLRGLQVVDLSDSGSPEISHFLRLPAVGQQMYVPHENLAILLASQGYAQRSEVLAVSIEGENIEAVSVVEIEGHIFDSRMIGDRLYTAAYSYEQVDEEDYSYFVWDDKLLISALDFSDPANPEKLEEIELPDASAVLTATPEYLIVASRNWRRLQNQRSDVFLFSLTDPESPLKPIQTFHTEGIILDKFKMSVHEGVITCISESNAFRPLGQRSTILETFTIQPSDNIELPEDENWLPPDFSELGDEVPDPNRLGRISLGEGERLFATRIVGDRAYIVTFLQIDPLWVVDLSDPANPTIRGELEIPGWSTYLQPLGDELFAVGVEDRRVSISLFDVADPSNPFLSDRVFLGEEGSYSWSEANYDEKAVTILPEQNLALIPFFEYNTGSFNQIARIQLIDFESGKLSLRGVIESDYNFRRASLVSDEIVSISNEELLIVDADDRDDPQLSSRLVLAWTVDRVIESGDLLLQLENGSAYPGGSKARVRMTTQEDPSTELAEVEIEGGRIAGATTKGNRLYCLVQTQEPLDEEDLWNFTQNLVLKTFEFGDSISEISSLDIAQDLSPNFEYNATWLNEDTLVWNGEGSHFYPYWRFIDFFPPFGYGSSVFEFHAIAASDDAPPTLLSSLEVEAVSFPEQSEGLSILPYFYSNRGVLNLDDRFYVAYQAQFDLKSEEAVQVAHFMKEVDFANPSNPLVSDPIAIPGELQHINRTNAGGILIFTTTTDYVIRDGSSQTLISLQASAFDDGAAFLLDEVEISASHSGALDFYQNTTFALPLQNWYRLPGEDTKIEHMIERKAFTDSGKFEELSSIVLDNPVSEIKVQNQTLFTIERDALTQNQALLLYDASDLSPGSSFSKFELDTIVHSLGNLSVGQNSLYFANGVYGISVYDLDFQLSQSSPGLVEPQVEVEWSRVASAGQFRVASSDIVSSEWKLAKALAAEIIYDPILDPQSNKNPVSDFQMQPALEIPLNGEDVSGISFSESSNLTSWSPYQGVLTERNSLLLPLVENTPVYLRADP